MLQLYLIIILKFCYNQKEKQKIGVIIIHGPSASGKTTFADSLHEKMVENEIPSMVINMDDYFNSVNKENYKEYDFDNPSRINWDNIHALLRDIDEDKEYLKTYKYCFKTNISTGPHEIKNVKPKVLIIEGIYAMNIFSKNCFDISKFDPRDPNKEGYMSNPNKYKNFWVFNIKFEMNYDEMKQKRISRDINERNSDKEQATYIFENQTWPATKKWVYSNKFKEDIWIENGGFNKNNSILELAQYIISKFDISLYTIFVMRGEKTKEFLKKLKSAENTHIELKDD